MKMLRKLYLSPFGFVISICLHFLSLFKRNFMVYGFRNRVEGKFYKNIRISSSAILVDKAKMNIQNNVWIGHYCLLDGIGGIYIGEGVNIASHSCIYTHSSHNAIRVMGKKFIEVQAAERSAYIIAGVEIGEFTFIGTSSVILPGTSIGRACIVGAGSVVKGKFSDYAVLVGNPAKVVGDSREIDRKLFLEGLNFEHYYDASISASFDKKNQN